MTKNTLYCHLGKLLEEHNITPYKLAKDTGERLGTIYKLVNNQDLDSARLPASLIANLCGYFGVGLSELFEVRVIEVDEN